MLQPKLPEEDCSLVIRTDFADEAGWNIVCEKIQAVQTEHQFQAFVECISDEACNGLAPAAICAMLPRGSERLFVFIVDTHTILNAEHPVLVVDTEDPNLTFRVLPSVAWMVESNLRLANMGFEDFELSLGTDGVFRGMDA